MRNRGFIIFRWISVLLIFATVMLLVLQVISFSRLRSNFPAGTLVGGVNIGGLDRQQAANRIVQAYGIPVEIHYGDAIIQIKPSEVGFTLNLEAMLTVADQQRISEDFWISFWNYLWNRLPPAPDVPLQASISEERLRIFLTDEVAARYDQSPTTALPLPGSTRFVSGESGTQLDVERAILLISDALKSPSSRVVNLTYNRIDPARPSFQNLQIMLEQVIDATKFDGLTEVYLVDLQSGQEISFAYEDGETLPSNIAFTAASTMKIPMMISVFRREDEPLPDDIANLMQLMIERSENDPADQLMAQVLDGNLGPLKVTDDLFALGLENSFMAGYFYPGAPLLRAYTTPANSRTDVNTDPDLFNQTTPVEIGTVLNDIYQCASKGGGTFAAVFPGEISQSECRSMINYLTLNRIAVLMQAGLPEGTQIAHKHGWITETDGLIHTISDAGIIYSPGGNFILTIFLNHPVQLVWDDANRLMANLSSAVYNYYNLSETQ